MATFSFLEESRRWRRLHFALAILLAVAFILPGSSAVKAAGPAGTGAIVTVVGIGENSIDLRFEIGQPSAPEGWLLAAPPVGDARLELLSQDVDRVPVAITGEGWMRDQRVVRLSLLPGISNRPEASAVIRIVFGGATPGQPGGVTAELPSDPWFESVFAANLLNHQQGRAWRTRPEVDPSAPAAQALYPPEARLRIETADAGIYRLAGSALQSAGWPAGWLDSAKLRLSTNSRTYELYVADGGDGRVDAGDYLEFYAPAGASRYSAGNVFWLSHVARQSHGGPGSIGRNSPVALPLTASPTAYPTTLRLEESHVYSSQLAATGEGWYWQRLTVRRGTASTYRFPFTLHALHNEGDPAALSLRLMPLDALPYQLQLSLNQYLLLDYTWDPSSNDLPRITFPASLLRNGDNEIQLTLTHTGQASTQSLLLDWLELHFQQRYASQGDAAVFSAPKLGLWRFEVPGFSTPDVSAYDVSVAGFPRRIASAQVAVDGSSFALRFVAQGDASTRFVAAGATAFRTPYIHLITPSAELAPQEGADWIALAPNELVTALQPLVDRRIARGLRARVVSLQAVYDAYADGLPEPGAIQRFLADAYANWPEPAPSFVLLVGDASYDPQNRLGLSPAPGIPTFLTPLDPIVGEIAAENGFAAIRGSDPIPDLAVGRLPVHSAAELAVVVAKILAYESRSPWQSENRPIRDFLLVDDPDNAGDFYLFADAAMRAVPESHQVDAAYYGLEPHQSAAAARAATISALNRGLLTLHYVGHGTPESWAGERLLAPEHIPLLTNVDHAPPAWSMSSLNGYFIDPINPSFLEQLLLAPNGGISAYVASTGVGLIVGNYLLHYGSLQRIMRYSPALMGLGFVSGKLTLFAEGPVYTQWLVEAYAFFGDPAMRLYLPEGGMYLPLIEARATDMTYRSSIDRIPTPE